METQIPDARLYKWIGNNEGHASEQPQPANASGVVAHHESHGPAPKNATPGAAIDSPAFGSSALGHKPAFKLRRFLSVASFLGVAAVIVGLLLFNRHFAFRALMEHETRSNVALTQAFANTHWPQYSAFVEGAQRLGGKEKLLEQPEIARLRADLLRQMKGLSVVKVKIYDLGGLTVFSTDAKQIGEDKSKNVGFLSARSGVTASDITFRQSFDAFEQVINDRNLVFSYIPIRDSATSRIEGVFEVYSDVSELVAQIEKTQWRIVAAVVGSLVVAGGAVIYATDSSSGTRLILGNGPITEQQIRDKLTSDGFSNIQISPQGSLLETIATKNGRPVRLEIDSQSGTVFQARGADDDDDD